MSSKENEIGEKPLWGIEGITVLDQTVYLNEKVNNITDFRRGMTEMFKVLRENLRSTKISDRTIVVTDFQDTENLNTVTKFGRYCGSEAYDNLPVLDFNVVEVKTGKSLFILKGMGEIILTRNAKELRNKYHFSSFLIGTYTVTNTSVQVNARIVRAKDLWVLSSASLVASRVDNEFLDDFFPVMKKKLENWSTDVKKPEKRVIQEKNYEYKIKK
ncbi:MAG: hypothetical protein HQK84_00470 [Nitrospinae bacterium]|nr:hypothetical protein [Nitrospinota bacterium]